MSEASEILRYTVEGPADAGETPRRPGERAMKVLSWGILVICLAVWTVVGALFWVPLLVRRIVGYSVRLVPSMLTVGKPWRAAKRLRNAMSFYARGFEVTRDMVMRDPDRDERPLFAGPEGGSRGIALIGELVWALVFWYAVLLLFGVVDGTPLDLWRHVADIPWSERVFHPTLEWVRAHLPLKVRRSS
jgi:hypothetical protein